MRGFHGMPQSLCVGQGRLRQLQVLGVFPLFLVCAGVSSDLSLTAATAEVSSLALTERVTRRTSVEASSTGLAARRAKAFLRSNTKQQLRSGLTKSQSRALSHASDAVTAKWWPFNFLSEDDDGSEDEPPTNPLQQDVAGTISIPGEGIVGDDEAAPAPLASSALRTAPGEIHKQQHRTSLASIVHARTSGWAPPNTYTTAPVSQLDLKPLEAARLAGLDVSEIEPESLNTDRSSYREPPAARRNQPASVTTLREFDVAPSDAGEDTSLSVVSGEESTKEDLQRQRAGQVEHVKKAPRARRRRLRRPHPALAASQQGTKVNASSSHADLVAMVPDHQKQHEQCLAFAMFVKLLGVKGPALVNAWLSTCQPAIIAGTATPQYSTMCNALGGAVSEFASDPLWTPQYACELIVRTFHESGIGASPLAML